MKEEEQQEVEPDYHVGRCAANQSFHHWDGKKTFRRSSREKTKDSETKVKTVSVGGTGVQSREHTKILTRGNGTGQVGGASDIIMLSEAAGVIFL